MAGPLGNLAIYYAVTPGSLVLTLNEPLLKRALDPASPRANWPKTDGKPRPFPTQTMAGHEPLSASETHSSGLFQALTRDSFTSSGRNNSFPGTTCPFLMNGAPLSGAGPDQTARQFWQTKLICPGGGLYVWNENGRRWNPGLRHPGEPKAGREKSATGEITGATLE